MSVASSREEAANEERDYRAHVTLVRYAEHVECDACRGLAIGCSACGGSGLTCSACGLASDDPDCACPHGDE